MYRKSFNHLILFAFVSLVAGSAFAEEVVDLIGTVQIEEHCVYESFGGDPCIRIQTAKGGFFYLTSVRDFEVIERVDRYPVASFDCGLSINCELPIGRKVLFITPEILLHDSGVSGELKSFRGYLVLD